ncbi:Protein ERP6 [Spathaspora sp. JA1]|nr:Protein ERP6 [Spathaspora sp. JA1]
MEISTLENDYHIPIDKREIGVIIDVEEVFNRNHRVVRQRGYAVGQFSFNTLDSGQHRICLTSKSFLRNNWFGDDYDYELVQDSKFTSVRIGIEFSMGDMETSLHYFKSMKDKIVGLTNKLLLIQQEQLFIRDKESIFRDLSERTCSTVINWVMIQLAMVLLIFIYQVFYYSKLYFAAKRKED